MSPDKLLLSQLVIAKLDNSERDKIARLNLKYDISPDITLRIGAKYREKTEIVPMVTVLYTCPELR